MPIKAVKVGRPFTYSDGAIECLLALRELFRLPYRQTEGLGRALVKLMDADVAIPDFTSLAKRAAKLERLAGSAARGRSDRRGGRQHGPEGVRRGRVA